MGPAGPRCGPMSAWRAYAAISVCALSWLWREGFPQNGAALTSVGRSDRAAVSDGAWGMGGALGGFGIVRSLAHKGRWFGAAGTG